MTIDPRILAIAASTLTTKQLIVWEMHHRDGMSFRAIAITTDLARTTVTDRYDGACRTLRKHGIMVAPDGRPYLAEQEPA